MTFSQPLPREAAGLIRMLKDQDRVSRQRAAYALGRVAPETEDILLALGDALFDMDDEVCIAAAISLFGCGGRAKLVLPQLITALQHRDVNVRCLAIGTLASLGSDGKDALPVLMEQLKSSDPRIRAWCTRAVNSIAPDSKKQEEKSTKRTA